jgi:hypothetical protein
VEDNGSASSTIVDVHKNGSTIYTTTGNRPTIAHDDADNMDETVPDVISFVKGDKFTFDIDQIATGADTLSCSMIVTPTISPRAEIVTADGEPVTVMRDLEA